ncbi:MAG: PQQ-binding-like beta-propeller repeat protein [bacterium]|nr:PQQ-binding-like beta-propeller repeat protein [bacterium]
MTCTSLRLGCVMLVLAAISFSAAAQTDWFQFQGPNRDGTSPETGLMRSWPESGLEVLWTVPLGAGYGGPAIRDGEVYVLDRVDEKQDVLRCLDLKTGAELWNYAYDAPGSAGHSGSRTVPTVDEQYVYSVGMMGDFVCVDRETHQLVWKKNILTDFGMKTPNWGVSQSPSLYKNLVIVAPQARSGYVAAFDRETGDLVWKSARQGGTGYSTPAITTLAGVEQAVMASTYGDVAGVSLEDGSTLWTYGGWRCKIPIPFPTPLPDDRLFVTGGYDAGSVMLKIVKKGGELTAKELFKTDECGSQIHQPLYLDGHLYVNSNSNSRNDGMLCMALDGKRKWRTRDMRGFPRFERGSLIMVDGMILNLDGKTGILHLIDPSPKEFKELARAKVLDGNKMWSPLALSQGLLLVRDQEQMKCLNLRKP